MSGDPSRTGRELWRYVDRDDPHNSGWWQVARLTRWDDGRVELETNTRGSVVPTTIVLPPEAVAELLGALGGGVLAELSTVLGTAEHALDELRGDVDLVRLVVETLREAGANNP